MPERCCGRATALVCGCVCGCVGLQMVSTHLSHGGGLETNAMGHVLTSESLAEDRWFLGYYEFVGICMREHVRQRLCRWQAGWNLWQVRPHQTPHAFWLFVA
jgi:hypothetical protein